MVTVIFRSLTNRLCDLNLETEKPHRDSTALI